MAEGRDGVVGSLRYCGEAWEVNELEFLTGGGGGRGGTGGKEEGREGSVSDGWQWVGEGWLWGDGEWEFQGSQWHRGM